MCGYCDVAVSQQARGLILAMALLMSPAGVKALEQHEGLELEAYLDAAGIYTIGYGHTGSEYAQPGTKITKQKARELLKQDIKEAEDAVNRLVKVGLNQPSFDALVSLVFNIGVGAFARSTLLKKLNSGDYLGAADQFNRWVFANGKKLNGLVKRRAAERAMFLSGVNILSTDDENEGNIIPDAPKAPNPAKEPGVIATGTVVAAGGLKELVEAVRPVEGANETMMYMWMVLAAVAVFFVIWKSRNS
jgi:lysozyme